MEAEPKAPPPTSILLHIIFPLKYLRGEVGKDKYFRGGGKKKIALLTIGAPYVLLGDIIAKIAASYFIN